jgi:hypothetical protein
MLMLTLTEQLYPQPTLTLYLGGSGIQVGRHLLSMMETLPADACGCIEPFFIDSQEPALEDHARSRHVCYQDLDVFYEPVFEEFSQRRFPSNLGTNPVMSSAKGCGVTRIFGTASLVACRDELANLVEQAMSRLRTRRRSTTQPLQIFLTASACGGTGAGMIIDAAALLRHFFRLRGESPSISLFLIGPSVFLDDPSIPLREDQRDRMRASTYAILKELHHFAQGNEFVSSYRLRDEKVVVGNKRDDDRLFDWVYYIDGHAEEGGATRSLEEVSWCIAETQIHLSVTEVGRKVNESMPNQREERVREYPLHSIHHDNNSHISESARARLQISSRKTFLASFATRNVRFPVDSIKQWFRRAWVHEALCKLLDRGETVAKGHFIDQFDTLLGYRNGEIQPRGLLAELGLTPEHLVLRVKDDADPARGMPPAAIPTTPEKTIEIGARMIDAAEWILSDVKSSSAMPEDLREEGELIPTETLLRQALPRWNEVWAIGLADGGAIADRLWEIATHPALGRGLRFLDGFLTHTAELLTKLAGERTLQPGLSELEERIAVTRRSVQGLQKSFDRETKSTLGVAWRRFNARLRGSRNVYSEALSKKTRALAHEITRLRAELITQRRRHIGDALTPRAWLEAALALKRWRDGVLAPVLTAAGNAMTLADNRQQLARQSLDIPTGENARGPWRAFTTVQIASDLLQSLSKRVANVRVEDLVLLPLHENGISRERTRLMSRTLASVGRETLVDMLFDHIEAETRASLAFLDSAWMLPEVAAGLPSVVAKALDTGSEPLLSFSRHALGQPLQSYLIRPPELVLPVPFGQRLDRMTSFRSRDPLQLGVVSFVFGIPPNSLDGMADLFQQYAIHVGDQERYRGRHDRYPLHVFRDAAEGFDEPHSPQAFKAGADVMLLTLDAARTLWNNNGGVHLDIRDINSGSQTLDWNQYVELLEKLLHELVRSDADARRLFEGGRFADLERLYNTRKHRTPDTQIS